MKRLSDWECICGKMNSKLRKNCKKCARVSLPAHRRTREFKPRRTREHRTAAILKRFGL